jgi:pseudolysin
VKKLLFALFILPFSSHAVEIHTLWGALPHSIGPSSLETQTKLVKKTNGHSRYQLVYQGIPIWGYQLIAHKNSAIAYSGHVITGVDKDISKTVAKLTKKDLVKRLALKPQQKAIINKIIYIDGNKAKLAYQVKYFDRTNKQLKQPNVILDANDGSVLKRFDNLHRVRVGQGPGGNWIFLPHRAGDFQYGEVAPWINALGKFDVTINKDECIVANDTFEVVNMQNRAFDWDLVPVTVAKEHDYPTFSYPCSRQSQYVNKDDGGYGPIHEGLSPINDTMYFAQTTLDMYQQLYGDDKPFGDDLPIRAYTHIANFDNAFSLGSEYEEGKLLYHQQIVLGNGQYEFAPMSQTTIPHELSHNVTGNYANLIYDGQSGGINEAFSDMADLALRDYLARLYPWYWNGRDWTIGREESLTATPLRYMERPSDDGYSIDTASQYYDGLDVHLSSGVFNRAFYLLANKDSFNAQKAFQVMFDANRYYWLPNTNFDIAACGVIQATKDRGWDEKAVIDAFKQVEVVCPLN